MVNNILESMFSNRNNILDKWGKDSTGTISYFFNSQGFRNKIDYDFIPDYAFFGCSSVFGIGVNEDETMVSYFPKSHNYGLAGEYLNIHSVENLRRFVNSLKDKKEIKIIFFWVERDSEDILQMSKEVEKISPGTIQISQGRKYPNLINLMPNVDYDITGTHPGPETHRIWAKTINLVCQNAR